MIVLDTNVLSELMRPAADPAVASWANRIPISDLFTTAVTQAEILAGLAVLPAGKRRGDLAIAAANVFDQLFFSRVLFFDTGAALQYAGVYAARRRAGRPIAVLDCQIAAIARAAGAAVATRNVKDFEGCGIEIVNPWIAGS